MIGCLALINHLQLVLAGKFPGKFGDVNHPDSEEITRRHPLLRLLSKQRRKMKRAIGIALANRFVVIAKCSANHQKFQVIYLQFTESYRLVYNHAQQRRPNATALGVRCQILLMIVITVSVKYR